MKLSNLQSRLSLLLRLIVAAVFVFAAVPKISSPVGFAQSIYYYHLAPSIVINSMAIVLPWLELFCAAALLIPSRARRAAYALTAGMLIIFTGAIIISLARGLDISCGCFSANGGGQQIGVLKVAENTGLLVAVIIPWIIDARTSKERGVKSGGG